MKQVKAGEFYKYVYTGGGYDLTVGRCYKIDKIDAVSGAVCVKHNDGTEAKWDRLAFAPQGKTVYWEYVTRARKSNLPAWF